MTETKKHLRRAILLKIDLELDVYFRIDEQAFSQTGDHALSNLGAMAASAKDSSLGFPLFAAKETRPSKHSQPVTHGHNAKRRISRLVDRLRREHPSRAAALRAHYTERDGKAAAKALGIERGTFYKHKLLGIRDLCKWWDEGK